ncbi:HAD family hydrolase [Candidatus Pacearchaeota archaeon]|nr:HAD family hydrolase [Candidatus Pacearchaeota archaeon]
MELSKYKTWFFDCDGVLLDSNQLKSEAFYEVALPYGEGNARALVEYNKRFGGVTRFEKFRYFFEIILEKKTFESEMENVLNDFSALICKKLLNCPETPGVRNFLDRLPTDTMKYVVSGGIQSEIQYIFKQRGLDIYFNSIYGSPDSKEVIMSNMVRSRKIELPAVFIGDSRYDYEIASKFNIDFIFMAKYTEFKDWELYFIDKRIEILESFSDLHLDN